MTDTGKEMDIPAVWKAILIGWASLVVLVGGCGNVLTLLALPYVRKKYGQEFMVLKSTTTSLLLHLSFCDLAYITIGLTHFIHAISVGAIALCVYRHRRCIPCQGRGSPRYHGEHGDWLFGTRYGLYFLVTLIWLISFAAISGDTFGVTGEFKWTGTQYGCDAVYSDSFNPGMLINIGLNLVVIGLCYGIIGCQIASQTSKAVGEGRPWAGILEAETRSFIRMVTILSVFYAISIVPTAIISWNMFNWEPLTTSNKTHTYQHTQPFYQTHSHFYNESNNYNQTHPFNQFYDPTHSYSLFKHMQNVFNLLYWSQYGINFVLYVTSNERMRQAYLRFLQDLVTTTNPSTTTPRVTDTSLSARFERHLGTLEADNLGFDHSNE